MKNRDFKKIWTIKIHHRTSALSSERSDGCLRPQEKQRFLTDVLHEVMLLDGLSSSHPISQEVERAVDIDRVFDWIAYKKVAPLQFLSPRRFDTNVFFTRFS